MSGNVCCVAFSAFGLVSYSVIPKSKLLDRESHIEDSVKQHNTRRI